jgi:hypothetical protein
VSDPSDEALLAAHLRGDPHAFGQLVARHERRVYGLCLRILGSREDAEDATQEAFLAALRKAASFRQAAAFTTRPGAGDAPGWRRWTPRTWAWPPTRPATRASWSPPP